MIKGFATLGMLALIAPLAGCPGASDDASANGTGSNGAATELQAPAFSADTAFAYLKRQVEFGPRVAGTPGHKAQLDWMTQFLKQRADTVTLQNFAHTHTSSGKKLVMTNVFARFKPNEPTRVLLIAHWDTRPTADNEYQEPQSSQAIPGANDGASGVAVLLEIANLLKRTPPRVGVDILLVDGEDYGPYGDDMYLGAKYFANSLPRGYKPLYGILLDMVGDQSPVYKVEGNSQRSAPEIVERVWSLAQRIGYERYFPRTSAGDITDDHIPLNNAGIRTIDIIDFDYPHWHKLSDDVVNTSPVGLGVVGKVLAELIWREG